MHAADDRTSKSGDAPPARSPALNPLQWEYSGRLGFHPARLSTELRPSDLDALDKAARGERRPRERRYALGSPVHFHLGDGSRGAAATYGPSDTGRGVELHVYALADKRVRSKYRWKGYAESLGPPDVPAELSLSLMSRLPSWSASGRAVPVPVVEDAAARSAGAGPPSTRRRRASPAAVGEFEPVADVFVTRAALAALADEQAHGGVSADLAVDAEATARAERMADHHRAVADMLAALRAGPLDRAQIAELLTGLPMALQVSPDLQLQTSVARRLYASFLMDRLDRYGMSDSILQAVGSAGRRSRFLKNLRREGVDRRAARSLIESVSRVRDEMARYHEDTSPFEFRGWGPHLSAIVTGGLLGIAGGALAAYAAAPYSPVALAALVGVPCALAALKRLALRHRDDLLYFVLDHTRTEDSAEGDSSNAED